VQSVTVFCALFFKRVSFRFFFPFISRVKAREQVVTTTHRVLIDSSQKKTKATKKNTQTKKRESKLSRWSSVLFYSCALYRCESSRNLSRGRKYSFFSRTHLTLSFCQKIIIIASKSLFSSKKLLFTSKSREKREEALVEAQSFSS